VLTRRDAVFVRDAVTDEHGLTARTDRLCCRLGVSLGRCRGFARGSGRGSIATHLKGDEGLVHFHDIPDVPVELDDRALVRTWQFNGGLRRLDVDERLVKGDNVAHVHLPADDLGLDESFADVRQ
jgi:hypothetical protein